MDLVRKILFAIEAQGTAGGEIDLKIPGHDEEHVASRVMLLKLGSLWQSTPPARHLLSRGREAVSA